MPLSKGGAVTRCTGEPYAVTDFGRHRRRVNFIPPQKAGRIAEERASPTAPAGARIDAGALESRLQPGVHVPGMPPSSGRCRVVFSCNCRSRRAQRRRPAALGADPGRAQADNTRYSRVAPDYGISVAGVYQPSNGQLADVPGSGGVSPGEAPRASRALEAALAEGWFRTITAEVFG